MNGYVLVSSLQRLDEQIAHLKDQLQELKAKTNLEAKYIKKESQVGLLETLGIIFDHGRNPGNEANRFLRQLVVGQCGGVSASSWQQGGCPIW